MTAAGGDLDDDKLWERVVAGDEAAFRVVYMRYKDGLYRAARRRLSDPSDVEVALQEAMANAWKYRATYEGPGNLRAWLMTILDNVCVDIGGRRSRDRASLDSPDKLGTVAGREEYLRAVREMLDQLPEDEQKMIILRDVEGLSVAEVREQMGLNRTQYDRLRTRSRISVARLLGYDQR